MSYEILTYKHLFPSGAVEYTADVRHVISRNSDGIPVATGFKLLESCCWETKEDAVNELKELIKSLPEALESPEHMFEVVHEEITSKIAIKLVHSSDLVLDSHVIFFRDMETGCTFYTASYGQMRSYISNSLKLKDSSLAKSYSKMSPEYAMYLVKKSAIPNFIAGKEKDDDYLPYPSYEDEKKLIKARKRLKTARKKTCERNAQIAFDNLHQKLKEPHAGTLSDRPPLECQSEFNHHLLKILSSTSSHTFSYDHLKDHVLFNMEYHFSNSKMPVVLPDSLKGLIQAACKEVSELNKSIKKKAFVEL